MIPNSFSFIDDHVAGSAYPYTIEQIEGLYDLGITDIITLTPDSPKELVRRSGLKMTVHHFPTMGKPHRDEIKRILDLIKHGRKEGRKFMVHCQYGQERTGIVLASYIEQELGLGKEETIRHLHKVRPISLKSIQSINYFKKLKVPR